MQLPPFEEFIKNIDFDKLSYDMERYSPDILKHSTDLFTKEQFIYMNTAFSVSIRVFLAQYHQWLSEMLQ